jgi:hypothetical protein
MGSLALSKEGLFILSVATVCFLLFPLRQPCSTRVIQQEEFIKRLAQGGHRQASAERRTSVNYRDMGASPPSSPQPFLTFLAATTQQYQEFMFLQGWRLCSNEISSYSSLKETMPSPVSLSEALQLRELHEKEMLEDDPALAAPTTYSSTAGYTPSTSKPKAKSRAANGKDKQNRHGSSSRAHSQVRWDYEDTPASNGHSHAAATASTSTRGGRESGWTRWPNGQNFIAVDPAGPQHNGFTSLAHQRPGPMPSANGHTPAPPQPRDAENPARLVRIYIHVRFRPSLLSSFLFSIQITGNVQLLRGPPASWTPPPRDNRTLFPMAVPLLNPRLTRVLPPHWHPPHPLHPRSRLYRRRL